MTAHQFIKFIHNHTFSTSTETDLHNVISKGNILQSMHIKFVTYQLMKALKFLHSGNVIHRDLKVRMRV